MIRSWFKKRKEMRDKKKTERQIQASENKVSRGKKRLEDKRNKKIKSFLKEQLDKEEALRRASLKAKLDEEKQRIDKEINEFDSLVKEMPGIQIVKPSGWTIGAEVEISWKTSGVIGKTAMASLIRGNGITVAPVGKIELGKGSYSWVLPNIDPENEYTIRFFEHSTRIVAESGKFKVKAKVSSPSE